LSINTAVICLPEKSLVPALDDLSSTKSKDEWLASRNAAVKLSTVLKCPLQQTNVNKLIIINITTMCKAPP